MKKNLLLLILTLLWLGCSDKKPTAGDDETPIDSNTTDSTIDTSGNQPPISSEISFSPVTPNSTAEAEKLYNFLAVNYGSYTISGVQTGDLNTAATLLEQEDLLAVKNAGGKFPALVGLDFLFANGVEASGSWHQEYTNHSVVLAEELWNAGGIPAFSWHWRDPSHTVDAFYTKGAGDPYTDFDFTKAFKAESMEWDTESETYAQLIRDIDIISELFLTLQGKNIAAIFRPLHECGGKWFWWSTQGGAAYAELFRLVYDRMVNKNGVKNLVWVWNPQKEVFTDAAWNPGADYYDVIGVDIYNNSFDYQSNKQQFIDMQANYGKGKILTLSENGPIPDASLMYADGFVWSWNMPWYESWGSNFVSKTADDVWEANLHSPCVYSLDKMPGWDSYSISQSPVAKCPDVGYKLGDLDTTVQSKPVVLDTANGNGWLHVGIDNMHTQVNANGDTTVPAAANLFLQPPADLSGASTASFVVKNTSFDGVWMSIAVLTGADANPAWEWQMPPDGCWINGESQETCSFDVSDLNMAEMDKIFIMVATEGYTGDLYFDDFTSDKGLIASFDNEDDIPTREEAGAEAYVKTLAIIGGK
ncbi:MAG: hypothetical protein GX801_11095 [Fibrobacter sp.]|nr:hypothetical protein [Fibrobacter sp.]